MLSAQRNEHNGKNLSFDWLNFTLSNPNLASSDAKMHHRPYINYLESIFKSGSIAEEISRREIGIVSDNETMCDVMRKLTTWFPFLSYIKSPFAKSGIYFIFGKNLDFGSLINLQASYTC